MRRLASRWFVLGLTAGAIVIVGLVNIYLGTQLQTNSSLSFFLSSSRLSYSSRQQYHRRPPLEEIVDGWNITGDVSSVLDFSIIGFPKCGTSSMMFHLQSHPEIQIFSDERCDLSYNQQVRLIRDIYDQFPDGDFVTGIKCPMDLENTQLAQRNYRKWFPKSKFIVGIRHPVLWFESFYNHRIHNEYAMKPPIEHIGKCKKGLWNVCTFRGNFHIFLSNLGKTNMSQDPEELQYVAPQYRRSLDPVPTRAPIFLYEVNQLSDSDTVREAQFLDELQRFLGLKTPIDSMIWFKPGRKHDDPKKMNRLATKKINICDEEHKQVKQILLEQAKNASRWIRRYFIRSSDVVVPSRGYFNQLVAKWELDPCFLENR